MGKFFAVQLVLIFGKLSAIHRERSGAPAYLRSGSPQRATRVCGMLRTESEMARKVLVAGWFSFVDGSATAGDLLTRDLTCEWLESAGYAYDVALAAPFEGGVDLQLVDPAQYSHVVFVCGPFRQGKLEAILLSRFRHCRLIGLNLTMRVPLEEWNPFDLLIERDSTVRTNADMAFLSRHPLVPVVGVCLVEYHEGGLTQLANAAIKRLVASREMAIVPIDTRLDIWSKGHRTPAEVESTLARMDVVITTRLHGTVLALKNGVPAISIDVTPGGAKLRRQAEKIGWPMVFHADSLTDEALDSALTFCLSESGRIEARKCSERASKMAEAVHDEFVAALRNPDELERRYFARMSTPPDEKWMLALAAADAEPVGAGPFIRRKIARLAKVVAWWTLPRPVHGWLQTQWQRR